jgi:hypothetical protein
MSVKKKAAKKGAKRAKSAKPLPRKGSVVKARAGTAKRAAAKKAPPAKKPVAKKLAAKKAAPKRLAAKKPVAKKLAAKKAAPKKLAGREATLAGPKPTQADLKRRDGAGHLDPKYAADLRERLKERPKDDNRAFTSDALSRELGEEFVETVTSGEDEGNEIRDKRTTEELGGPFTVSSGGTEFASGVDPSNPKTSTREPFPRT